MNTAIIAQNGSDAWWYLIVEELLPAKYDDIAARYGKGTGTMDVWLDSELFGRSSRRHCLIWLLIEDATLIKSKLKYTHGSTKLRSHMKGSLGITNGWKLSI